MLAGSRRPDGDVLRHETMIAQRPAPNWHAVCIGGHMELAVALIVLMVGLALERGRTETEPVRVRTNRR